MNDIDRADQVSAVRPYLLYLFAIVIMLSLITTADAGAVISRLLSWFFAIVLGAANVSTIGFARSGRLQALLNDESTRAHRSMAMTCGFSAALLSGLGVVVVSALMPLSAIFVARLIVTVTLFTALVSFATLELRAAR